MFPRLYLIKAPDEMNTSNLEIFLCGFNKPAHAVHAACRNGLIVNEKYSDWSNALTWTLLMG
jgi:hypothetical protein